MASSGVRVAAVVSDTDGGRRGTAASVLSPGVRVAAVPDTDVVRPRAAASVASSGLRVVLDMDGGRRGTAASVVSPGVRVAAVPDTGGGRPRAAASVAAQRTDDGTWGRADGGRPVTAASEVAQRTDDGTWERADGGRPVTELVSIVVADTGGRRRMAVVSVAAGLDTTGGPPGMAPGTSAVDRAESDPAAAATGMSAVGAAMSGRGPRRLVTGGTSGRRVASSPAPGGPGRRWSRRMTSTRASSRPRCGRSCAR